ncbi:MAG: hypothetical protein H6739_41770 [Alphaproteobacteria bacterium]|nr:hypothetical protein [Alphaproteobacteria bacterium]
MTFEAIDLWTPLVDGPALTAPAKAALGLVPLGWLWQGHLRRSGVRGGILWWLPAGLAACGVAIALLALSVLELAMMLPSWCGGIRGDQWAWIALGAHQQQAVVLGMVALLLAPVALWSREADRALGALWTLVAAMGLGVCLVGASRLELLGLHRMRDPPSIPRLVARLEGTTAVLDGLIPLLVVGLVVVLVSSAVALWRAPANPRGWWERRIGLALLVGTLAGQGATTAWGIAVDTLSLRPDLDQALRETRVPTTAAPFGDGVLVGTHGVRGPDGAALSPPRWRLVGLLLSPPLARYVRGLEGPWGPRLWPADTPVASLLDQDLLRVMTLDHQASTDRAARRAAAGRMHEIHVAQSSLLLEGNLELSRVLGSGEGPLLVAAAEARTADVDGRCAWLVVDPGWTLQELVDARVSLMASGAMEVIVVPPDVAPIARALLWEGP